MTEEEKFMKSEMEMLFKEVVAIVGEEQAYKLWERYKLREEDDRPGEWADAVKLTGELRRRNLKK